MDLAKELARQAKKKGICKPWYNELKSLNGDNINAMAQMYLKGIDFCLANDYPDKSSAVLPPFRQTCGKR
jgi:hypothetical protein